MAINFQRNIGMLLLAVWLILNGLPITPRAPLPDGRSGVTRGHSDSPDGFRSREHGERFRSGDDSPDSGP